MVREAKQLGWRVLLDAASFLPTANLRLNEIKPDFVALSIYKIIGYPTGVGALVARNDTKHCGSSLSVVCRGTVHWVSVASGVASTQQRAVNNLKMARRLRGSGNSHQRHCALPRMQRVSVSRRRTHHTTQQGNAASPRFGTQTAHRWSHCTGRTNCVIVAPPLHLQSTIRGQVIPYTIEHARDASRCRIRGGGCFLQSRLFPNGRSISLQRVRPAALDALGRRVHHSPNSARCPGQSGSRGYSDLRSVWAARPRDVVRVLNFAPVDTRRPVAELTKRFWMSVVPGGARALHTRHQCATRDKLIDDKFRQANGLT